MLDKRRLFLRLSLKPVDPGHTADEHVQRQFVWVGHKSSALKYPRLAHWVPAASDVNERADNLVLLPPYQRVNASHD